MTATTLPWREAFEAFERLLALDDAARAAELEELQARRPDLHARVARLLAADSAAETSAFLSTAEPAPSRSAGDRVGPYQLERPLGSGGMGEVWLARRADGVFDSPVALKLLHAHLAHSSARDRFVREGRILGQLTHPNVARLLDAGVAASGQMYLAIEHVEGDHLDRWCETQQLGVDARLRLFLQVCDAVAHAHAHLTVHRDLKPSNILVTADGVAKLLDFGVAKLMESVEAQAAQTELTRLGGRALTPEYAAPEQISDAPVTVATDVYSLGVILYELLSGQRPYGGESQSVSQLERAVLETEPPSPSRAAALPSVRKTLAGDLDTIALKALKKNPAERYLSALALADDLKRYLADQPVLARPDSIAYRARKYVRRNRLAVAAAAAIALAIGAGLAAFLLEARETQRKAVALAAREGELEQVVSFQSGLMQRINVEQLGGGWLNLMRDRVSGHLQSDSALTPQARQQRLESFDELRQMSDATEIARESLDKFVLAPSLQETTQRFATQPSLRLRLTQSVAQAEFDIGRYAEAKAALEHAIADLTPSLGAEAPEILDAQLLLARALAGPAASDAAVALAERVVALRERTLGADATPTLAARAVLADVVWRHEDAKRALEIAEKLRADQTRILGAEHPDTLTSGHLVAEIYTETGQFDRARPIYDDLMAIQKRIWNEDDPRTLRTLLGMQVLTITTGDFQECRRISALLIERSRRILGEDHPRTLMAMVNYANVVSAGGEVLRARDLYGEVYRRSLSLLGVENRITQTTGENYAYTLDQLGDAAQAITIEESVVAARRRNFGASNQLTLRSHNILAVILADLGRFREADAVLAQALAGLTQAVGPEHPDTLLTHFATGWVQYLEKRHADALATLRGTLDTQVKVYGPDHSLVLQVRTTIARSLIALGRAPEAEPLLRDALAKYEKHTGPQHYNALSTRSALAEALHAMHRDEEAATLAAQGYEGLRKLLGDAAPATVDAKRILTLVGHHK